MIPILVSVTAAGSPLTDTEVEEIRLAAADPVRLSNLIGAHLDRRFRGTQVTTELRCVLDAEADRVLHICGLDDVWMAWVAMAPDRRTAYVRVAERNR